jgi:hypothetical protein
MGAMDKAPVTEIHVKYICIQTFWSHRQTKIGRTRHITIPLVVSFNSNKYSSVINHLNAVLSIIGNKDNEGAGNTKTTP